MSVRWSGVLWAGFFLLFSADKTRANALRLSVSSVVRLSGGVQVGSNQFYFSQSLQVFNQENYSGDFFVTFSVPPGGVGSRRLFSGSDEIAYQLLETPTSSIPLKDFPDVHSGEVLRGRFGAVDSQRQLEFSVRLSGNTWLPPGIYSDSIVLRLFTGTIDESVEVGSQLIEIEWSVPQRTDLSLVGRGGNFMTGSSSALIDFGMIEEEVARALDCVVRSNVGYSVSFLSDTGGALVHSSGFRIPYTLAVDGTVIDLKAAVEAAPVWGLTSTGQGGRSHEMTVTLDPRPGQEAGNYSDNIRISIWAQ
ncbi:MAG: hypothetical protein HOI66_05430 [Verrucomicrobia bacterium]|nr:hypothetical protein [Verrucomicrobiota bacterium]